ncbi:MAG: c-type cytochrome [Myxococcota bacterium]
MKKLALAVLLAVAVPFTALAGDETAALYKKHCKSCHGMDGKADTKTGKKEKMTDISTAEWQSKNSDEKIFKVISNGEKDTKMKPFKEKLSEDEIKGLVKFVRGFGKG